MRLPNSLGNQATPNREILGIMIEIEAVKLSRCLSNTSLSHLNNTLIEGVRKKRDKKAIYFLEKIILVVKKLTSPKFQFS